MIRTIISIGIIIVAITLVVGFAKPRYDNIKDLKTRQAELQMALENSEKLRQAWNDLLNSYNAIDPIALDRMTEMIPDNIDNVQLIIEIDNLVKNNNLQLSGISVAEEKASVSKGTPLPFGALSVEFTVDGEYDNFKVFMNHVEKSLRILDIASLQFYAGREDDSGSDFEYSVVLNTYWLR
ncbi:MAG: Tfp pilus assembly protein PilO [Planctomycetota bacterium]|jgi:Tfp pilus assembly protein PilO